MRFRLGAVVLLLLVACPQRTTTPPAGRQESRSPKAKEFPATSITATLDRPYNSSGGAFDPSLLGGLTSGQIEARWYTSGTFWAVFYEGLDLEETGPLCPGNSIEAGGSFQFVTNTPTGEGACEGATTARPTSPSGVFLCDGRVFYISGIPASQQGFLWGSVEKFQPDRTFVGLTSRVATAPSPPNIHPLDFGCSVPGT